jgi:hypothetical protein
MLIDGVHIIFIAPPVLLILLAIVVGGWRLSQRGVKAAVISVLFALWSTAALLSSFCSFCYWLLLRNRRPLTEQVVETRRVGFGSE